MQIQLARTEADILKCWPVMKLLRPHLEEEKFIPLVKEMLSEGYELAFIEANGIAAAAIGYRYEQKLFDGKQIYVDDLTTLEAHRGKGYAGQLLDFVFDLARQRGASRRSAVCAVVGPGISAVESSRRRPPRRRRSSPLSLRSGWTAARPSPRSARPDRRL